MFRSGIFLFLPFPLRRRGKGKTKKTFDRSCNNYFNYSIRFVKMKDFFKIFPNNAYLTKEQLMNESNFEKLVNAASKKLGTSPEKLRKTLEKGDVKALSAGLSKADKDKLRAVLANEELMKKLKGASNPEDLMKILGNK